MDLCHDAGQADPFEGAPDGAPVQLLRRSVLEGCNVHHDNTVIVQDIDLGMLSGCSSDRACLDFANRFVERFRGLKATVPGSDMAPSLLDDLQSPSGAPFDLLLLEAILAVETAMAFELGHLEPIPFARVEAGSSPSEAALIWSCSRTRIAKRAVSVGLAGLLDLLPPSLYPYGEPQAESFGDALEALRAYARRRRMAPTTAALVLAAKRRGIPCEALGGPRLRIGQGVSQRHVFASVTASTSFWACRLSGDKRKTNRRLAELGLPVPAQIKVLDVPEAEEAAEALGYPVVVKPLKGKKGGAVTAGIEQRAHLAEAFTLAEQAGSGVIVERCVEGADHRLLVIGGRLIAAARRTPPMIEGDGDLTIRQLIDELNADPDRDDFRMMRVAIDGALESFLAKSGHELGDVPDRGQLICLRSTANGSTGGVFTDVTSKVHPDNRELAVRAAQAVELDVAGVDFLTTDISRSYKEIGGSIIEINSRPGLRPHTWPSHGEPRDVAGALLEFALPNGSDGRIPTLLVAGDRGTGRVARALDAILRGAGKTTALVTRQASFLNGVPTGFDEKRQGRAASILLRDPELEALVSTISLRRIVQHGLSFDRCQAAAVMNRVIEGNVEPFRRGLDVIAKAAGGLVVGADNMVALEALHDLDTGRLTLVSPRLRGPVIERHLAAGGAAVVKLWNAGQDRIVLYDNDHVAATIPIEPSTNRSRARTRDIEATMFAMALAYGIGLRGPDIEAAIRHAPSAVSRPRRNVVALHAESQHQENRNRMIGLGE